MRNRLSAAIAWSGTDVTLSMFVLFKQSVRTAFPPLDVPVSPEQTRRYELEDGSNVLRGGRVCEYDLVWKQLPADLEGIVTSYLVAAIRQGADAAWFAFEGSFNYEYLLHPEVASQTYAV